MSQKQKLYSTTQTAKRIGVSRQTLYTWIDEGFIAAPAPIAPGVRLWTAAQIAAAAKMKGKLKPGPVPAKRGKEQR